MSRVAAPARLQFGILTAQAQVEYHDLLRVWQEADAQPLLEHAWLFDHLMPLGGDPNGPAFESWTLLAALAAQTHRLRLGVLVTSNRFRPPAVLAKIAAGVDVISGGRLDLGIGAGSRPGHPVARREYAAHGLPFLDAAEAVAALAEACAVIRRLWTQDEPFDVHGEHVQLVGAFCSPKPVQRPHPPILVGGRAAATLRVAAEHADLWNHPGDDLDDAAARSAVLDRYCADLGRDPADITRSIVVPVHQDDAAASRKAVDRAVDAGFTHLVLGLSPPYRPGLTAWLVDEVVARYSRTAVASTSTSRSGPARAETPIPVNGGTGVVPSRAAARATPSSSRGVLSGDQSTT